jgi:hypothetical protein
MPIVIEDAAHCQHVEHCDTFEEAIAWLEEAATIPWDQEPNRCPCTAWRRCGRKYRVIEFDDSTVPWTRLREADVLNVSARGVEWVPGYEYAWREPGGE